MPRMGFCWKKQWSEMIIWIWHCSWLFNIIEHIKIMRWTLPKVLQTCCFSDNKYSKYPGFTLCGAKPYHWYTIYMRKVRSTTPVTRTCSVNMPALNLEDAVQISIREAQMKMGMITMAKIISALIALVGEFCGTKAAKGTTNSTRVK